MKKVLRSELLDYQTFADRRADMEAAIINAKSIRRLEAGFFSFLFENTDTMRFQIQEMMRVEKLVRESDIQHELDTYNALLGGPSDLALTLLIGITDVEQRPRILRELLPLPQHLFAVMEDGSHLPLEFDPEQVGDDRLSSVQFLKIVSNGQIPVSLRCTMPGYGFELPLPQVLRVAVQQDLV